MEIGRSFQCEGFGSHKALGLSLVENWNWNKLGSQSASKTWSSETLEEVFGEQAVCIVLEFTLYIWMQFELMM